MSSHQDADKFIVRLPDGLRARLLATAKANGRSANSEAVLALSRHLNAGTSPAPASDQSMPDIWQLLDDETLGKIARAALQSGRSLAAETATRIAASLARDGKARIDDGRGSTPPENGAEDEGYPR